MTDDPSGQEQKEKKQHSDATDHSNHGGWAEIIKVVNSPLAYFVVPSLCFESLTVAALFSSMTEQHKFYAFIIGQVCVLLGFAIVAVIPDWRINQ